MKPSALCAVAGLLAAAPLAAAAPLHDDAEGRNNPCAQISAWVASRGGSNSTQLAQLTLPGQLAYDCLASVPFNASLSVEYALEVQKYLQFQSTADLLAAPPPGYQSPPVDLLGGMQALIARARAAGFQTQLEFETALTHLFWQTRDGHLNIRPCLAGSVFTFRRDLPLVSLSPDGVAPPRVYALQDALLLAKGLPSSSSSSCVSPVRLIQGQDAAQFLDRAKEIINAQSPDTRYNMLFPTVAGQVASGAAVAGTFSRGQGVWPGTNLTRITFDNGTTLDVPTTARLALKSFKFPSGKLMYQTACLQSSSSSSSALGGGLAGLLANLTKSLPANMTKKAQPRPPQPKTLPPQPPYPQYPPAVIRSDWNLVSGYYLNRATAVLFVPTFSPWDHGGQDLPDHSFRVWVQQVSAFVAQARQDGRSRIIVDVSGNPGGDINLGQALYKIFFPHQPIQTISRTRAHPLWELMVKAGSSITSDTLALFGHKASRHGVFAFQTFVTPDQRAAYADMAAFYGPFALGDGLFTNVYANSNLSRASTARTPIPGYGDAVDMALPAAPFAPRDIVVMTDGICASTCATFVNLMRNYEGVRTLVFGGRPQPGPAVAVGGVKGAQYVGFADIDRYVAAAIDLVGNASFPRALDDAELARLRELAPVGNGKLPILTTKAGVNLRNAYNFDDPAVPLQFKTEYADCRLFYTARSMADPAKQWEAVERAMWEGGSCVPGSANAPGSIGTMSERNQQGQLVA